MRGPQKIRTGSERKGGRSCLRSLEPDRGQFFRLMMSRLQHLRPDNSIHVHINEIAALQLRERARDALAIGYRVFLESNNALRPLSAYLKVAYVIPLKSLRRMEVRPPSAMSLPRQLDYEPPSVFVALRSMSSIPSDREFYVRPVHYPRLFPPIGDLPLVTTYQISRASSYGREYSRWVQIEEGLNRTPECPAQP